ncbi:SAM-dependent methyltransferase [Prescottella equi]|uniref:SAM-dependent methyltransferase n=1 Tax=Rhodococcus hoagii TaxID=43767 RepID=UPI001EEADDB5|nr:SAM-dependent methyltransferase [Prescottella equi]
MNMRDNDPICAEPDGTLNYGQHMLAKYNSRVSAWSNSLVWKCPTASLLQYYDDNIGTRHLEVGARSAWFLEQANPPTTMAETYILGPKTRETIAAKKRLTDQGLLTRVYISSVMAPIAPSVGCFDSIAANLVFHRIPGTWSEKSLAIRYISDALKENGVFFGATILGVGVRHNLLGRTLRGVFNSRLGGFHNSKDDKDGLVDVLEAFFERVNVVVEGSVAKFIARRPRSESDESPHALPQPEGSDLLVCPGQL